MPKHAYARHQTELEIPFFDVDSMNIVWHGNYVKYLEIARCDFLARIGHTYLDMAQSGYGWPVVKLDLKYVKPAKFAQKIRIDCALTEYESCLKIDYTIRDAASGTLLTRAATTQVAVSVQSGEMQFQTPECWQTAVRALPDF